MVRICQPALSVVLRRNLTGFYTHFEGQHTPLSGCVAPPFFVRCSMEKAIHPALHFQVQIEYWEEALRKPSGSSRKAYCQNMVKELDQDDTQFQEVRRAFRKRGTGLILKSWKNWCVIMRDRERPVFYRFQIFNESGVVAHYTRRTADAVLLEAFKAGFRIVDDSNTLRRLTRNPKWNPHQVSHAMPPASA